MLNRPMFERPHHVKIEMPECVSTMEKGDTSLAPGIGRTPSKVQRSSRIFMHLML